MALAPGTERRAAERIPPAACWGLLFLGGLAETRGRGYGFRDGDGLGAGFEESGDLVEDGAEGGWGELGWGGCHCFVPKGPKS